MNLRMMTAGHPMPIEQMAGFSIRLGTNRLHPFRRAAAVRTMRNGHVRLSYASLIRPAIASISASSSS